jgi:tetratricopeptide (TPR) repeat protein
MVATREKWENESLLPRTPSPEQMLAFFGIPPYSPEALDENIKKKRRRWNRLSNSGNADGREKAEKVLTLIQRISEAIKRGAEGEQGGGVESEIPAEIYETVEELWHILEEYLFAFEYDDAIRVARDAIKRWQNADAAGALAWVVSATISSDGFASPALLAEGLEAARVAIRDQPGVVRNWESAASLLLADNKVAEAVGAIDQAERATGGNATAMLYLLRTRAMVAMKRRDEAMTAAVLAVTRSEPARAAAVRSEATDLLVTWVADLLPIKSPTALGQFTEMVDVAAWCSYGVPEAEDQVRPYRMWATNAGKRVFTGSDRMRSFLAVITGFISLPIHNFVRSRPAWQVFNEGQDKPVTDAFFIVAAPGYVQQIHNVRLELSFQRE